jgi:hypothetical protein
MRKANDDLEQVYSSLKAEQIDEPGVYDDLSAKDVLAHITAWQGMVLTWLRDTQEGRAPTRYAPGFEVGPGTPEEESEVTMHLLNAQIKQKYQDSSFNEVLHEYRRGHLQLLAFVDGMSDEEINDTGRFFWLEGAPVWASIAGNSFEHIAEHLGLIHLWLDSQGGQHGS